MQLFYYCTYFVFAQRLLLDITWLLRDFCHVHTLWPATVNLQGSFISEYELQILGGLAIEVLWICYKFSWNTLDVCFPEKIIHKVCIGSLTADHMGPAEPRLFHHFYGRANLLGGQEVLDGKSRGETWRKSRKITKYSGENNNHKCIASIFAFRVLWVPMLATWMVAPHEWR